MVPLAAIDYSTITRACWGRWLDIARPRRCSLPPPLVAFGANALSQGTGTQQAGNRVVARIAALESSESHETRRSRSHLGRRVVV